MKKLILCVAILLGCFIVKGQTSQNDAKGQNLLLKYSVLEVANGKFGKDANDMTVEEYKKANSSTFKILVYDDIVKIGQNWYTIEKKTFQKGTLFIELYNEKVGNVVLSLSEFDKAYTEVLMVYTDQIDIYGRKVITFLKVYNHGFDN
ncbi:MAG: hypothetical protein J6V74_00925 [Bacteroidales bacterium]|nr:hypothetical protein [Bacteroidales bacterium]